MRQSGFTLLEMTMSTSILAIVGLLSFVVISSSTESAELARAKSEIQGGLRDVMAAITGEAREAYTARTVAAAPPRSPAGVASIQVSGNDDRITFQIPVRTDGPQMVIGSTPIVIAHENEDTDTGNGQNALLDPGEDVNSDGMLNRRVLRIQNGEQEVLGASNDISGLRFELRPNQNAFDNTPTTLFVWLEASKRYGSGLKHIVRAELESSIDLKN